MQAVTITQITLDELESMIDRVLKSNTPKQQTNEKLSVQEVANELGVTILTVHNYIKRGTLLAFKIGRRVYIKREDLEQALKEKKSLKYKR